MSDHRLDPTAVDNFGHPTTVVWGDIWNDSDDATYAEFGDSDTSSQGAHGFLPAYTGGVIHAMTLHFRASATGDTNQPLFAELDDIAPGYGAIMRFYGGASTGEASQEAWYGPGANWDIPNDGVIRDYSTDATPAMIEGAGWDALDDFRDLLSIERCSLFFWADAYDTDPLTFPTGEIRIYKAWLVINDDDDSPTGVADPVRRRFWPKKD